MDECAGSGPIQCRTLCRKVHRISRGKRRVTCGLVWHGPCYASGVSNKLFAPLALGAIAAFGCGAVGEQSEEDIRAGERKIVGPAVPYPADATLARRASDLVKSKKLRREVAWQAIARALKPIEVREKTLKGADGNLVRLPLFRTWYGRDDVDRVFDKAYSSLSTADKARSRPFTNSELASAYDWNVKSATSWKDSDYLSRVRAVSDEESEQGVAGNSRVSYSPGYVSHLLKNYGSATDCIASASSFGLDSRPAPSNFAPCFASEFPIDAAVIKASWWRSNFDAGLPIRQTDAKTLARRLAGTLDEGAWNGKTEPTATPTASEIYTVKMTDNATFRLAGIHLITKETRDWLWITLFWSDTPDTDFGQDRPAEIKALGEPWNHYKMAVAVGFEEQDPDPRGGFTGTLGDALAATHDKVSWASNPYIERGAHNAQTNCIGCHQHSADSTLNSEKILADEVKFPKAGRSKLREVFASDYSFSVFGMPEGLAPAMKERMR
jgi:hypothetical protein